MTVNTINLISRFEETHDVLLVPQIVIALQEEDAWSEFVDCPSQIRSLRNVAAHEPANLVNALNTARRSGSAKLDINCKNGDVLVIGVANLLYWILIGASKKHDYYQVFGKALFKFLYPKFGTVQQLPIDLGEYDVRTTVWLEQKWFEETGRIKLIDFNDAFTIDALNKNRKLFWRICYPHPFELLAAIFGSNTKFAKTTLDYVYAVYQERGV